METRREILRNGVAGTLALALPHRPSLAVPSPKQGEIRSITRVDNTLVRYGGDCGVVGITWAANGTQLLHTMDGDGWPVREADRRYVCTALGIVHGGPQKAQIRNDQLYPTVGLWDWYGRDPDNVSPYYGIGIVDVEGVIYSFQSSFAHSRRMQEKYAKDPALKGAIDGGSYWNSVRIILSKDGGQTWSETPAGTPIQFPRQSAKSPKEFLFLNEENGIFSDLKILQMGRAYSANTDGYVYGYSANGQWDWLRKITLGTPNEVVLFRVPKEKLLQRSGYEFFSGFTKSRKPIWSYDIKDRKPILSLPADAGIVSSVVYNAPLKTYVMSTGGSAEGKSCLGIWSAPSPYGPWTQRLDDRNWIVDEDILTRPGGPIFCPKWISEDGRSMWLCWFETAVGITEEVYLPHKQARNEAEFIKRRRQLGRYSPNFGFNIARYDIKLD